jgi:hypothetical protein
MRDLSQIEDDRLGVARNDRTRSRLVARMTLETGRILD